MALPGFHPVFLFLLWLHAVAAHVEPPTNVTLHCHNLENVVEWSYSQLVPELKFRVYTGGQSSDARVLWVYPPTLQADVSSLSNPGESYYLSVTAMIGENKSAVAPPGGITFSYYKDSPAGKKCFLDFPSVNITAQEDDNILVHFTHPWLLYHHKVTSRPQAKSRISKPLPELEYTVVISNQTKPPMRFTCEESVCQEKLSVDPGQEKYCVTITGVMQKMSVQGTQEYCAQPSKILPHTTDYTYVYIAVVCFVASIAFTVVLIMVYQKMTRPSTAYPDSMTITSRLKQWTLGVVQEPVFVPVVGSTSPTPLLTPIEEKKGNEYPPADISSADPEILLPLGMSNKDEGVCDMVDEGNEVPGYMPGNNLEDDTSSFSEATSGYEKRQVFLDLAPDEQTEGYCARTVGTEDSGSLDVTH